METVQVSSVPLRQQLEQARQLLQDARYKQAIRLLDSALQSASLLVDRLQIQAQRALAQALWKKPEAAIEDASAILLAVQADTPHLSALEIDWDYERSQDIGHLGFLAEIYQLRGLMFLLRQAPKRAVEDLSLSLFMTAAEKDKNLNYLQRAIALIEMNDCLERALEDLKLVWQSNPALLQEWFHLPEQGSFELQEQLFFVHAEGRIKLSLEKVRPKINRLHSGWLRLSQRFGL